jgi:hypothetical protein
MWLIANRKSPNPRASEFLTRWLPFCLRFFSLPVFFIKKNTAGWAVDLNKIPMAFDLL